MSRGYALVLGGGGAKGAYQIGVWKALREMGIRIEAIFGTSVGAINACLIGQGDYFLAEQLWTSLTLSQVFVLPEGLVQDGRLVLTKKNLFIFRDFLRNTFKEGGLNTQPLRQLVETYLDEQKLRKSGLDIGLISVRLSDFSPLRIFLSEASPGSWVSYLLASAAFPGFKSPQINGIRYIDGGLYNNVPHELAKQRGYKRIIVVDNSGIGNNRFPDIAGTETVYVKNSMNFGGEFDFVPDILQKWIKLGYYDTLQVFGSVEGRRYFYRKNPKALAKMEKLLFDIRLRQHISAVFAREGLVFHPESWEKEIRSHLPDEYAFLPSLVEALMEYAAYTLSVPRLFLYGWNDWERTVKKHVYEWSGKLSVASFFTDLLTRKRTHLPLHVLKILFLASDNLLS